MKNVLLLFIIVVLLVFVIAIISKKSASKGKKSSELDYKSKAQLLTENELHLLKILKLSLPDCHVFCHVSMRQLIESKNQACINKISQKSIDFVICDNQSKILACIELDDKTHDTKKRIKKDDDKDLAFKTAGLKLLRWRKNTIPKYSEIKTAVLGE